MKRDKFKTILCSDYKIFYENLKVTDCVLYVLVLLIIAIDINIENY